MVWYILDYDLIRRTLFVLLGLLFIMIPLNAQYLQQGGKLVGTGAAGSPFQGYSVALSDDGNTAIVGGYYDNGAKGAAWIYTRNGGEWTQQGNKLVGTGAIGNAQQGISVALSGDGNTAIIGGIADNSAAGAAWVFTRSGGVWTQQGSKLKGTGAIGTAQQGVSVALSLDGSTALVGGYTDNNLVGAVWVFTRSGGSWSQQGAKLVGTGAVGHAWQGVSVSLSADGNTALVGGNNDNNSGGAVWVYTRNGNVWKQQGSKLSGTDAIGNAQQGFSVSLSADGNTAIVGGWADNGTAGAAWVFTRTDTVWAQQGTKLVGADASWDARQGFSVSISADGNAAIVGGEIDTYYAGAAWVFARREDGWFQAGGKLVGTEGAANARQGHAVSLSADGNTAIVGGYNDGTQTGAAWMYQSLGLPSITGVRDIADDQGGYLRLEWSRSSYDNPLSHPTVASYGIWRSGAAVSASQKLSAPSGRRSESVPPGYQYVAGVPATQSGVYQMVLPTSEDSSASGTSWSGFIIVALTQDTGEQYVSTIDSGYSVDNLSPGAPAGLLASVMAGPGVALTWDAPTDTDVAHYAIHRSTTSGFTPEEATLIGTADSNVYLDTLPVPGVPSYYRVAAVDIHDNPGPPAEEASAAMIVTSQFSVREEWNIVSVPLAMSGCTATQLFPGAASNAFAFSDAYFASDTLRNGVGYWMKFSAGDQITQAGLDRTEDTIAVNEGWNIVGGLSTGIAASGVGSIPGGLVTSSFFGFTPEGYRSSPTLEAGMGYWVKVSEAGQLVLTSTTAIPAGSLIRVEETDEVPPPPPDRANDATPSAFALGQNYPNPFNPVTTIRYSLPSRAWVRISVFNMLGQAVADLVDESQEPGDRRVSFDGSSFPSGVYTCRITAGSFTDVKKMMLVK